MWKTLTKSDAAKIMLSWKANEVPSADCDDKYIELRKKLLKAERKTEEYIKNNEIKSRKEYFHDLLFGLELYDVLNNDYYFSERNASNDEIWIYLSIKVIPDIVYNRWGLTETRFYKQSRRIWLRTLWWYIHLSWLGSKKETFNLLKNHTTDEIVQLVERSGPQGYRIDLTREIMKQFGSLNEKHDRNLFRKIMKLNIARLKIVEPCLTKGGTKQYVKELIEYFDNTDEKTSARDNVKHTANT